ncbi:hypothetical protein [Streptomyces inhibens]|uniref:hypothetical protein n=1 Tax=Streptomyces inhibens TaxID=2293571 RepID=UPI0015F2797E|nr:hypothetical protein [Streptomyces inhibens]
MFVAEDAGALEAGHLDEHAPGGRPAVGVTAEFAVLIERCQGGNGNGNHSLTILGSE